VLAARRHRGVIERVDLLGMVDAERVVAAAARLGIPPEPEDLLRARSHAECGADVHVDLHADGAQRGAIERARSLQIADAGPDVIEVDDGGVAGGGHGSSSVWTAKVGPPTGLSRGSGDVQRPARLRRPRIRRANGSATTFPAKLALAARQPQPPPPLCDEPRE